MTFWLLVVGVVSLSIGFVMGATFRQYRPIKLDSPKVGKLNPSNVAVIRYDRIWYGDKPPGWAVAKEVKEGPEINQTFYVQGADSVRAAVGTRSPVGHQYPLNGDRRNWTP